MNTLPPFYVGQQVVSIENHSQGLFKKGEKFTITSIKKSCCGFDVTVGIIATLPFVRCVCCGARYKNSEQAVFHSKRFAPIQADFQEITYEEIMEKESHLINAN